jgi:hypothetical protein
MTTPIYDPWSSMSVTNDHGLRDWPSICDITDTYSGKLSVVKNTVGHWRMRPRTVICSAYSYGTIGALIDNFLWNIANSEVRSVLTYSVYVPV